MSDYNTAPTDPHHGGKLMLHQMPARIKELEAQLAEQVAWVQELATELQAAEADLAMLEESLEYEDDSLQAVEAKLAATMDSLQDVSTDFNDAHREKLEAEAMLPRAYLAGVDAGESLRVIPIPTSADLVAMLKEKDT